MSEIEANAAEQKAINALRRLAKTWPKSLWLFSASGTLCVMQRSPDGEKAKVRGGGMDQEYVLTTINIPNDGGDW